MAKCLGVKRAAVARTRRTVRGGRAIGPHRMRHCTRPQVAQIPAAYKPRKADHETAIVCLARTVTAVQSAQRFRRATAHDAQDLQKCAFYARLTGR
jgi:hypothetical protein